MKRIVVKGLSYTGGVLVILTLLGALGIFVLPYVIKWQANSWFEARGLKSSIGEIELKLFDSQFFLRNLVVNDEAGGRPLVIGYLSIQLVPGDLLHKKITVEKIEAGDLYVDVEQDQLGLMKVAGIRAGSQTQSEINSATTDKTEPVSETSESNPWHFLLHGIEINKLAFCYRIAETASSRAYHSCASLDAFSWKGNAEYTMYPEAGNALSGLKAEFDSGFYGFSVDDIKLNRKVMRFDSLRFDGVRVNGVENVQTNQVLMEHYSALQTKSPEQSSGQADYLLSAGRLAISDIRLEELSSLAINAIRVSGLVAKLQVNPDGGVELKNTIKEFSLPVYKPAGKEGEKSEPKPVNEITLRLGELAIDGDSNVAIKDESVKPVFNNMLSNIRLSLKDVDTADRAADTQVKITLVAGEHGEVDTQGTIKLFAEKPTLALKVNLVGINVGDFDAYAHEVVQHKVKSGHLDANIDIKVDQGILDTSSKVTLHKFYVETLGEKEASQYKEKLGIPLSSALALLRERDDSISIKMPVTGDVENPDFSIADIVRQVSILAIKQAVISYYTPFGLVKLLTKGFDLATALRFEPVLFEVGKFEIDNQGSDQLDKLARLLTERPRIHLVLCGHATRKDFASLFPSEAVHAMDILKKKNKEALPEENVVTAGEKKADIPVPENVRKKLDELASNRGKAILQYLVEKHKIESDRLILCNPEFDIMDDGQIRAEISI